MCDVANGFQSQLFASRHTQHSTNDNIHRYTHKAHRSTPLTLSFAVFLLDIYTKCNGYARIRENPKHKRWEKMISKSG